VHKALRLLRASEKLAHRFGDFGEAVTFMRDQPHRVGLGRGRKHRYGCLRTGFALQFGWILHYKIRSGEPFSP